MILSTQLPSADEGEFGDGQYSSHSPESSANGYPATHHVERLSTSAEMALEPDKAADQRAHGRANSGDYSSSDGCLPRNLPQPDDINVNPQMIRGLGSGTKQTTEDHISEREKECPSPYMQAKR